MLPRTHAYLIERALAASEHAAGAAGANPGSRKPGTGLRLEKPSGVAGDAVATAGATGAGRAG